MDDDNDNDGFKYVRDSGKRADICTNTNANNIIPYDKSVVGVAANCFCYIHQGRLNGDGEGIMLIFARW